MTNENKSTFAAAIEAAVISLRSTKAGSIAQHIIPILFPKTKAAADDEGGLTFFETGVTSAIRAQIKAMPMATEDEQDSFFKKHPKLFPYIQELSHGTYYVPSVEEYVAIFELCEKPELLDSARKFLHTKSAEIENEATKLDDLYDAVMRARRRGKTATEAAAEAVQNLSPAE